MDIPEQLPCDYIGWVVADVILLLVIILGNVLTVLAVRLSRCLRTDASSQFVLSLAVSDLMVGLALSYHLIFFIDVDLNGTEVACLLRFEVFTLACCASLFNVTAIAVDRYLAIVHPLKYPRFVARKAVCATIAGGWIFSAVVATMPIYWNSYDANAGCEFATVLPR